MVHWIVGILKKCLEQTESGFPVFEVQLLHFVAYSRVGRDEKLGIHLPS